MQGPSERFTGAVYVDTVATPSAASRLHASSVHLTPVAPRFVGFDLVSNLCGGAARWTRIAPVRG